MDWYSIFYWLTVADKVKQFFDTTSTLFTVLSVVFFIALIGFTWAKAFQISENKTRNNEEDTTNPTLRGLEFAKKRVQSLFYSFLALSLITWAGYVAVPSKTDCLIIIAGGSVGNFITTDSSSTQIPKDVTRFLHLSLQKEISSLDADARRELGMQTPKEQLLDKVKDLTKEQLINYLQTDTTILK